MRNLWSAISFLSVVNILAILLAVGWLHQSGRLDRDRIERLRAMFRLPVVEEEAMLAAAAAEAESMSEPTELEEVERRWGPIPVSNLAIAEAAERTLDLGRETTAAIHADAQAIVARIEADHARRRAELAALRSALERDQRRFEEITRRARDEDFAQTVTDLEEMKLDTAFSIVRTWLADDRRALVVDVLAAMDAGRRAAVLGEFVDIGRDEVAADLQLALRDRTAMAGSGTESADAESDAQPAFPAGNRPFAASGVPTAGVGPR